MNPFAFSFDMETLPEPRANVIVTRHIVNIQVLPIKYVDSEMTLFCQTPLPVVLRRALSAALLFVAVSTSALISPTNIVAQGPRKAATRPAPQKPQPAKTPSQSSPPVETVTVDSNLAAIQVIATDASGRYVSDLRQDEFSVYEDDEKQNVEFFKTENAPLNIVLVLDTSASSDERLQQIRRAALSFVDHLKPADRMKVITFADEVNDLSEFTNNHEQLKTAILKTRTGQGTRLYDAFDFALASIRKIQGRKAIILYSDGVDWHSERTTFDQTLRALDEDGVMIYPVRSDTRVQAEQIARGQDSNSQLPTISVVRNPSAGAPEFPPDDTPTQTETRRIGLPQTPEVISQRPARRPPDDEPRTPSNRRPADNRDPVDERSKTRPRGAPTILSPNQSKDPAARSSTAKDPDWRDPGMPLEGMPMRGEKRRDDPIKAMLDEIYVNADGYLKALADKSAGRLLRADTAASLPDAFTKIAAELRTQYSIGYHPSNSDHDGQYRKIKIVVSRPNVTVRARSGYRASGY
jgi:Mg-chelatase subunit ChlD